ILTILGNSAVLATAVKRSSLLKSSELLTVNLAVADIGMALSMYPLAIASAWNHAWLGGDASCVYYALMGFLFGVCSMMTLCAMAVIRFLATNSSKSNKSDKVLLSLLQAEPLSQLPQLLLLRLVLQTLPQLSSLLWTRSSPSVFSCQEGPASTARVLQFGCGPTHTSCALVSNPACASCRQNHRTTKSQNSSVPLQMAVLISVAFLSSWTPYAAASFWSIFNSSDSFQPVVTLLPCLFAKSSTAYNPVIYYVFSKTFRGEVRKLRCCCGWRVHYFSSDISAENAVSTWWSG
ncbi:OPN5 protein, partial [Illadopsis cleaveri]|nr:OPN5 protein [Illadopsis cleaveri]